MTLPTRRCALGRTSGLRSPLVAAHPEGNVGLDKEPGLVTCSTSSLETYRAYSYSPETCTNLVSCTKHPDLVLRDPGLYRL